MTNKQTWIKLSSLIGMMMAMGLGCEKTPIEGTGDISQAELSGVSSSFATASSGTGGGAGGWTSSGTSSGSGTTPATSNSGPSEITGSIKWLGTDVSGWAVTASLSAHVGGGSISMPYSKAKVWPSQGGVNANCWAIVNIGGIWYAATFEYLRYGQTSKPMSVLSKTDGKGDHFKVSPLSSWTPHSGERFGIMVSGLMRGSARNVKERSNISMVTWP